MLTIFCCYSRSYAVLLAARLACHKFPKASFAHLLRCLSMGVSCGCDCGVKYSVYWRCAYFTCFPNNLLLFILWKLISLVIGNCLVFVETLIFCITKGTGALGYNNKKKGIELAGSAADSHDPHVKL